MRASVLRAYRQVLRAQRHRFRGDAAMITAAHAETRGAFEANRGERDEGEVRRMLADAEEARDFVLHGMVQGVLNERDTYELKYDEFTAAADGEPKDPHKGG